MSEKKKKHPDSLIITNATRSVSDYLLDTWWKWWQEAEELQTSNKSEDPNSLLNEASK